MIDDTKHFCGVDEKHLMGSSFINIPANERKTRVKDESFRMITSVLSRLKPSKKVILQKNLSKNESFR